MKTMPPTLAPDSAPAPAGDETAAWRLIITGESEPLFLARALQKLAVPEITVMQVRYEVAGTTSHAELCFQARAPRARLAAVRLEKLIGVRSVALSEAPG